MPTSIEFSDIENHFKRLLDTVEDALDAQYKKSRLRDKAYADVYASSISAAMQHAMTLGMQKDQIEAQTALTALQTANEARKGILLDRQSSKIVQEIRLLIAKTNTERAQVKENYLDSTITVDGTTGVLTEVVGSTISVEGVVRKQKDLYSKQIDGYDRDAEQKAAKLVIDTWNIRYSKEGNSVVTPLGMQDNPIDQVINKLRAGIGNSVLDLKNSDNTDHPDF